MALAGASIYGVVSYAVGLTAAAGLTGLLQALLFGGGGRDPDTVAGVAVLRTVVALAACFIPARRPMRLDPARRPFRDCMGLIWLGEEQVQGGPTTSYVGYSSIVRGL